MSVEIIETKSRAEAIEQSRHLRHEPDVIGIEFLKAGKTLRVTRSGDQEQAEEPVDEQASDEQAGSTEVPGELVESEIAGTDEAVNAETGEVTAPGEPLPVIATSDGDSIVPAGKPPLTEESQAAVDAAIADAAPASGDENQD